MRWLARHALVACRITPATIVKVAQGVSEARKDLTTAPDGPLDMVALGTPHFSLSEFERLVPLVAVVIGLFQLFP